MHGKHLWQGEWIDETTLQQRLEKINEHISSIKGNVFELEYLLDISQKMHEKLLEKGALYERFLLHAIQTHGVDRSKAEGMLQSIISFLSREQLRRKLSRELGTDTPFTLSKPSHKESCFESWAPMGVLVHIAPTNVFTIGVLCVIEGLLSGNINILKTSANQHQLPQLFFEALLEFDHENFIKPYVIIVEIPSSDRLLLQQLINCADVVSAWGSEEAIKSVQSMTPQGVRFVEWGHKISFAYFSREHCSDSEAMEKVCEDICLIDQNACSSPQDVFVECEDFEALKTFADRFAEALERVSERTLRSQASTAQLAEISTVVSVAKTEQALGLTHVRQAEDCSWCVIADKRSGLSISPLYRTIWIKALLPDSIVSTLHPMKGYLQTAALIAPKERILPLTQLFLGAGCLRIKAAGHMHDNYIGEPHDGVYALPSFMKRVSLDVNELTEGIGSFGQFAQHWSPTFADASVMDKADFQALEVQSEYCDLTFTSGGSSGKATYSYFTYEDYHTQMKQIAEGLHSAGLDPKTDSVINMFGAGHLYGGFLSFFTIMESLGVRQYPMGVSEDPVVVGKLIVEKRINTIFSLPSLIIKLFKVNEALFRKERVIKKVFFGGDHFGKTQAQYLKDHFGVELIRAAAYGSNDAGPLGYQCPDCDTNEYHLLSGIQVLEVVDLEEDRVLPPETAGRLLFSSRHRKGQKIIRYDVGDTGFLHGKPCPCGRSDNKFTLLGRSSDIFKVGGPFLSFDRFATVLQEGFQYSDLLQLVIEEEGETIKLTVRVEESLAASAQEITSYLLKHYEYLRVSVDLGIELCVVTMAADEFESVVRSGKVRHLVDKRSL